MMKNSIYIRLLAVAALSAMAAACSVDDGLNADRLPSGSQVTVSPVPQDVVEGELFVRFDERVADVIEAYGVAVKSGVADCSRSGVLTVDEILEIVDGYHIERVFPKDIRNEEKTRREGLHLWYLVRFSEEHPVDEVASRFSVLGEVSKVSYNRRLKRTEGQVRPLTVQQVQALSQASGYYNDPLLKYQWHLVNNGYEQEIPVDRPSLPQAEFKTGADVNVKSAWDKCKGHPSIIVAVLDEGVDVTHPDLLGSLWTNEGEQWRSREDNDGNGYAGDLYGYNFINNTGVISTGGRFDSGHGTHVAGVIAATNDNNIGISSIAGGTESEPGVRIMSCQIFSGSLGGTLFDEIRAIKYAADNGAVVLQCSWGYISGAANPTEWPPQFSTDEEWITYNELEKMAFDYFVHNAGSPDGVVEGGIVVFAAGNESAPASSYPAAYSDYISVAAIAPDFTPAVYTNYGPGTTISAPGGDQDYYYAYGTSFDAGLSGCILSTLPYTVTGTSAGEFSGYGYMEGTSMACPHVSGVVALGLSYAARLRKHFKAVDVKELLYKSSRPFEARWSSMYGYPDKMYYKYVASQQEVYYTGMNLENYKGKMGHGLVDAAAFLDAIASGGVVMKFPNVFVNLSSPKTYDLEAYMDSPSAGNAFVYEVGDASVASVAVDGTRLTVTGLKEGQTVASVSNGSQTHEFVITVRSTAADNGWM